MLKPKMKFYSLSHDEYSKSRDNIIRNETQDGYTMTEDRYEIGLHKYVLAFDLKEPYFDVFVKWSDEKKERVCGRELTYKEMCRTIERLLTIRKDHFINNMPRVYPEYVRVE